MEFLLELTQKAEEAGSILLEKINSLSEVEKTAVFGFLLILLAAVFWLIYRKYRRPKYGSKLRGNIEAMRADAPFKKNR